jgi:transmembrane sensor
MVMPRIPAEETQAEAASWLVRLQSENRRTADVSAFQDWLAADPTHATAFEAVSGTWDLTGGLPRDLRGYGGVPRTSNRRTVMAGAASLLAAGGSLVFWHNIQAGIFQTEVGEQKHVALDDGTRMFLDTDTRLKINFNDSRRTAELLYGRVNFQVASDPIRPFVVNAAQSRIVADPSGLDVRLDGEQLSVVIIRGAAEVLRANTQPEKLLSGDRLVAEPGGTRRDRPAMAPLLAWQTGQAIFENGRLSEAVAEMNRYSTVKLTISDADTAALRVSGIYSVGDNVAFASSISRLLRVRIVQEAGRIDIVADKARPMPG